MHAWPPLAILLQYSYDSGRTVSCTLLTWLHALFQVAFWLMRNGHRVLIAACDTFRSGAVEQLKTHAQHLSSLNPPKCEGGPSNVLLFDRGYKKDPSGVAMEAIHFGVLLFLYKA